MGKSGAKSGFRHAEPDRTVPLAAYCKAVNLCSLMGATAVLLRTGHLHEAYALCRVIDEQGADILFATKRGDAWSSADGRVWERYSCFDDATLPVAIKPADTDPNAATVSNQCRCLDGIAVPREPAIHSADTDLLLTGREGGTLAQWATVIEQI